MLIAGLYFELAINIFVKNLHETGFNPQVTDTSISFGKLDIPMTTVSRFCTPIATEFRS
jgi:hypothetical protein